MSKEFIIEENTNDVYEVVGTVVCMTSREDFFGIAKTTALGMEDVKKKHDFDKMFIIGTKDGITFNTIAFGKKVGNVFLSSLVRNVKPKQESTIEEIEKELKVEEPPIIESTDDVDELEPLEYEDWFDKYIVDKDMGEYYERLNGTFGHDQGSTTEEWMDMYKNFYLTKFEPLE